jgi:hypothetical protein
MIGPNGGMIVSGEKGSIQLDKNDSLIAGTNLLGNSKSKSTQQTTTSNNSITSSDLKDFKDSIMAIANRPVNVGIDGEKVLKATTGKYSNTYGDEVGKNSYKIQ